MGADGAPAEAKESLARYGFATTTRYPSGSRKWDRADARFDLAINPNEANRFGWIVEIDPTDPEAMQAALSGGLFEPAPTPEQERAKERLELLLALVEGWVDEIVAQATAGVMPAAVALSEAFRRRRGGRELS